jgi:ectoine hydroxylase-related dioxygenase (phytanoyl-CoA dioxygenase family)
MSAAARTDPAIVDQASIDAFRRDGFVHLKGQVPLADIGRYGAEVARAVAARTAQDHRPLGERTPFQQSFTMCQSIWEDFPEVGHLTFHPRIAGAAAALIGAERVRLWHDQALFKEAHGRETEMHQDHPYWPIAERDALTAWIPLVEIDEAMGCMGYIPGSHRGDETFIDVFTKPGMGHAFQAKQTKTPVFVTCKPGDVIFHHGSTIHLAKPNRTGEVRKVHTAIYFADGCHRADDRRQHYTLDRSAIAPGAVIDGDGTPVAFPLPGGRLPVAPPFPQFDEHSKLGATARIGVFPRVVRPEYQ